MNEVERYQADVKAARREIWISLSGALTAVMFMIIAVGLAIEPPHYYTLLPCGGLVAVIAMLVRHDKRMKTRLRENTEPYVFLLSRCYDYQTLLECMAIGNRPLCKNGEDAAVLYYNDEYVGRILLLDLPEFSTAEMKKKKDSTNRKANRQHPTKNEDTMEKVARMLRINCVVTEEITPELSKHLCQNADMMMRRNEIVVKMSVVGNRLLVMPIHGITSANIPSIERYRVAVEMMRQL